jgi:hypothetical protein
MPAFVVCGGIDYSGISIMVSSGCSALRRRILASLLVRLRTLEHFLCVYSGRLACWGYWVEFRGHLASHLVSQVINIDGALIGSNIKIDFHILFVFLLGEDIVLKIN